MEYLGWDAMGIWEGTTPSHPFPSFLLPLSPIFPFPAQKAMDGTVGMPKSLFKFIYFFNPMEIQKFFRHPAPFLSRIVIKNANHFLGKRDDIYGIKGWKGRRGWVKWS